MTLRASSRRMFFLSGLLLALFLALCLILVDARMPALGDAETNRIRIDYVPPTNPAHEPIYNMLKEERALEKLQEMFSVFKLPASLTLRIADCGGSVNAWYFNRVVLVCYEYLEAIHKNLPKDPKSEVMAKDAMCGQFFYVFAHEMGHAVFDVLSIPVWGMPEDAADQFATFLMLQFGKDEARRLVTGAAYAFSDSVMTTEVTKPLQAFSDVHGFPQQRFFNLLCLAYGADPQTFKDLVDRGYLPQNRATTCRMAYGEVRYAFVKLIEPHVDMGLAKGVLKKEWMPPGHRETAAN